MAHQHPVVSVVKRWLSHIKEMTLGGRAFPQAYADAIDFILFHIFQQLMGFMPCLDA
jgi:hypothetical protein